MFDIWQWGGMMTNDQCEQSTTVSFSISNSANLKYHDWSLGRRKCCGVFYSSNIDIASCQLRGSWTWKMLRLEIKGSGTGWRSKQLFYGGRYEQRLDYKFVKEKRGLQQERLNLHRRWSNQLSWIKTWKSGSQSKFEIAHPPRWGPVGVEMQFG